MSRRRTTAATFAVLLVVSAVASSSGVALAGATLDDGRGDGPPAGFVGVASSNITENLPAEARGPGGPIPRGPAWEGQVMASSNASTLALEVSTQARAFDHGQNTQGRPGGRVGLALVLEDDTNHAGRQVTVHADLLEQALGYVPREATVHHSSGDTYETPVERRGEWVVFDVREFSSNTVTFDGEVALEGSQATDGAQFSYGLDDYTSASDPAGDLTGVEATEWDNASGAGLANGDTLAVAPAGDEIRGPAAGDPEVVLTGEGYSTARTDSGTIAPSATTSFVNDGNLEPEGPSANGNPTLRVETGKETYEHGGAGGNQRFVGSWDSGTQYHSEMQFNAPPALIESVTFNLDSANGNPQDTVEVYAVNEGTDGTFKEGTLVATEDISTWSLGNNTITFDSAYEVPNPSQPVTLEFVTTTSTSNSDTWQISYDDGNDCDCYEQNVFDDDATDAGQAWIRGGAQNLGASGDQGSSVSFGNMSVGATATKEIDLNAGASALDWSGAGDVSFTLDYTERGATEDPELDLDGDGVNDINHTGILHDGDTVSYAASSLGVGDDTTTISTVGGSTVGVEVRLEEVVKTRDPTVEVNGQVIGSHTGTLAVGETVNFTEASTVLQNGTNTLNISVGDGTLSTDAPTPQVGFTYSHSARYDRSVNYSGETWSERYDVTREWGDANQNATLTIPFEGNVVAMRGLTLYVNGTETPPTWSEFKENSTTLEVGLGDLGTNATTRVVANGSKVRVGGSGTIAVREPTVAGDGLDSKIELTSWTNDSYIDVSGTSKAQWVHHTASESWDTPESYVTRTASGDQTLHLPDAVDGSTTRVQTVPLEVTPESGGVEVEVLDAAVDVDGDGTTDSPRFRVRQGNAAGADTVEVVFHDVQTGETYELYDETNERGVDTDTSESPVFFATSGDLATYVVRLYEPSSSDPPAVVSVDDSSDSGESPFGSLLVLGGVVAGILVFWYLGRRFTGARGFRDNYLLLAGGGAVALVGVSAVGGGSAWSVLERVAATPAGAIVGSVAAMLAIQRVDEWTGWVPTLAKAAAALGLGFWVIQVLTDGALSEGVAEVAPFLVVLGVLVFAVLAWRALKGPTINIRGGGGAA